MAWFKRKEKGITTATEDKMDVPKGLGISLPQEKLLMLMS
jgi:acetyl-CoA carboxylase carboxyl transferase subunit beta